MKIIVHGILSTRKTCHRCCCIFEYDRADIHIDNCDVDGEYAHVNCPTCKAPISVPAPISPLFERWHDDCDPY